MFAIGLDIIYNGMSIRAIIVPALYIIFLTACSTPRFVTKAKEPKTDITKATAFDQMPFKNAHIGISIYDIAAEKYVYDYQGDKYFVPASNTKIFTLYAGMKYLRDSLPGIAYEESADTLFIYPTADPSFLHTDFKKQPVVAKLQQTSKPIVVIDNQWNEEALGPGWSWDDYNDGYMAERNSFPAYGNVIKWTQVSQKNTQREVEDSMQTFVFSEPEVNWKVRFKEDTANKIFFVKRRKDENYFEVSQGKEQLKEQLVPFVTNGLQSTLELLKDTIHKNIIVQQGKRNAKPLILYSQPSDSLYKLMMYRSDNFFAEQMLLMAANEKLAIMNDSKIIGQLLDSELKDLPQKPIWVDGSGLSRYNLFTPQDFVWILNKMNTEFGFERLKGIFPGSGQGTLLNYYKNDSGYIYAKTGSMSGVICLSGFLIAPKNKLLAFSVLVNNQTGSATDIRKGVEAFLMDFRRKY